MDTETWRGSAEIWTADTYHIGLWPCAWLDIKSGEIQIRTPKKQVTIAAEDTIEIRRYLLPWPSLTVISRDNNQSMLISFSPTMTMNGKQLANSMEQAGFEITEVSTWRTGLRASHDGRKYQLQTNSNEQIRSN